MKILINALSGIGDAVMFSPALTLLKKYFPDSEIDMLVMFRQVEELYKENSFLNKIYFVDFLNQSKIKSLKSVLGLRRNKYDVSVNVYPSNRREYNLINFLIGAHKRIAKRYMNYSKTNLDFLNTSLSQEIKDRHNVLQNLDLIKLLIPAVKDEEAGNYVVNLGKDDILFAENYVSENSLKGKFLAGIHAGSAVFKGHINKRWGTGNFISLLNLLHEKYSVSALIFGTEKDVNEKILSETNSFTKFINTRTLTESIALMKYCKLFISNDSALLHLAAALNIQSVGIFGYTNSKELYPWKSRHIIVRKEFECTPCFFNSPRAVNCKFKGEDEFKCMKTISVEEVFAACVKLIEEMPGNIKP